MIRKLKTKEEHKQALAKLETWMADGDKPAPPNIEALIQAIVNYEDKHYPI